MGFSGHNDAILIRTEHRSRCFRKRIGFISSEVARNSVSGAAIAYACFRRKSTGSWNI